ncbi:epoxide hydrolase family protein [Candidatus Rariloculus sp.]|uniref:epoxide hydrolase family protein n=1 Tax=Candidatus Rariloculus sp. TaxID=3101265 RepID=UPI003D0A6C80
MRYRTLTIIFALAGLTDGGSVRAQSEQPDDRGVEPFTIDVPEAVLDDLNERLDRTRWPDQLPGTGWDQGADTAYMRELAEYWRNDYDWRAEEARLNGFEHFRATVDGLGVHFVHERSADPDAVPLLLLHGWPSSFVQMLDLVPLLTQPGEHGLPDSPSFHVVVASLPGFGFSDVPNRTLFGFASSARLMAELMHDVLGYERYGVRGSDLGGVIVRQMALMNPDQVIGVHLTGIIGSGGGEPPYTEAEEAFIAAGAAIDQEVAYSRLHMSKPQTLAHSLQDSPVGLAAWIVEKFRAWSDSGGDVESRFTKDELLTNLMVYWVTGTAPASVRTYYDFVREPRQPGWIETPVGMLDTTKDLFPAAPREWGERLFNVQSWNVTDVGGHFLEWEEPELVARDLQEFFGSIDR